MNVELKIDEDGRPRLELRDDDGNLLAEPLAAYLDPLRAQGAAGQLLPALLGIVASLLGQKSNGHTAAPVAGAVPAKTEAAPRD